jgi:glycine/D-amino acid oxidase-like deaminating enzyme
MKTKRYLIVGQGLAGATLALQLHARGHEVHCLKDPCLPEASRVAPGLINPITGRRWVLTAGYADYWAQAQDFYRFAEERLGCQLLYHEPACRIFGTMQELELFRQRSVQADYKPYLGCYQPPGTLPWDDPWGSVLLPQVRRLDVRRFLDAVATLVPTHLGAIGSQPGLLQAMAHGADRGWDAVVLAQGAWGYTQGLWQDKGHVLRGDVLHVALPPGLHVDSLYLKSIWLMPLAFGCPVLPKDADACQQVLLAATHQLVQPDSLTAHPQEAYMQQGREVLLKALQGLLGAKALPPEAFRVVEHRWGFRPCSNNRLPFVGPHPHQPGVYVLNGFGSKGVLTLPYWAAHLAQALP